MRNNVMDVTEDTPPEKGASFCKRKNCYTPAVPGNGQFPFCSKSCRNKDDYQTKNKVMMKDLNAIRSEISRQDKLLKELYRKWGSGHWEMVHLQIEGFTDGGYCKTVKHHKSGKLMRIFLYYCLLCDLENNTYQIYPENELRTD
jgi:hypothetical protein